MLGDLLAVLASLVAAIAPPAAPAPAPTPPQVPAQPVPSVPHSPPPAPPATPTVSTAYCLTDKMANGRRAHVGAVASNRHPFGTRLWLEDSPWGPAEFVVEDRIGWGSQLDFAMPGDCWGARRWGRRVVAVATLAS